MVHIVLTALTNGTYSYHCALDGVYLWLCLGSSLFRCWPGGSTRPSCKLMAQPSPLNFISKFRSVNNSDTMQNGLAGAVCRYLEVAKNIQWDSTSVEWRRLFLTALLPVGLLKCKAGMPKVAGWRLTGDMFHFYSILYLNFFVIISVP